MRNVFKKWLVLLVVFFTIILPCSTTQASSFSAITNAKATIYAEPNVKSQHMTLSKGTLLLIKEVKGGAYKVEYNGKTGYIKDLKYTPVTTTTINSDKVKIYKSKSTSSASTSISKGTKVNIVDTSGEWAYIEKGGKFGYVQKEYLSEFKAAATPTPKPTSTPSPTPKPTATPTPKPTATPESKVMEMDWWTSGIQKIFSVGTVATVTDCSSGLTWKVKRSGGTNHADSQPLTSADTETMKKAYGGKWSWDRHAIWVSIGGKKYAASMNGMPHGSGSISGNDFDGHFCIHFTNSRTHGTNKICALHQAAIKKALNKK